MKVSDYGEIVLDCWEWLSKQYAYVYPDTFIVMPNHLHGILIIDDDCGIGEGGSRTAPTNRKPLGRLIGAFKTVSTKRINIFRKTSKEKLWQRNYYEHVIRNEDDLHQIREYIINNPLKWELDEDNPKTWDNIK